MKTDGFGITHRDHCTAPAWNVIRMRHSTGQKCKNCGITWRPGEPTLTPRPMTGYRKER